MNRTARLKSIYAEIPDVGCKGLCGNFCCVVPMSPLELYLLTGGQRLPMSENDPLRCPLWSESEGCTAYENRPTVCRLWGAVEEMACPHGCRPPQWVTDLHARSIIDRIGAMSPGLVMPVDEDDFALAVGQLEEVQP